MSACALSVDSATDNYPRCATENRNLSDPEEIEKALKLGEYIRNGAWVPVFTTCIDAVYMSNADLLCDDRRNARPLLPPEISTSEKDVS